MNEHGFFVRNLAEFIVSLWIWMCFRGVMKGK